MRRREDFTIALRSGRRVGRRRLVVYVFAREDDDPPRAGFIVGRGVGRAVQRNKVRRRLRHMVLERLHRLPAGSLLVVRANPSAADSSVDEIARELDSALERALGPRHRR